MMLVIVICTLHSFEVTLAKDLQNFVSDVLHFVPPGWQDLKPNMPSLLMGNLGLLLWQEQDGFPFLFTNLNSVLGR